MVAANSNLRNTLQKYIDFSVKEFINHPFKKNIHRKELLLTTFTT